jgi:hypothetical protein
MLAQHIGYNRLIIQSYCIYGGGTNNEGWRFFNEFDSCTLYDDCNIIWSGFQDISIEHGSREVNQVAHNLAKRAMQYKQTCTCVDESPSFILDLLINDITILNV